MRKVALVVGGTGGIGSAVSAALAGGDWKVYVTYHRNQESAARLAQDHHMCAVQCDLSQANSVVTLVAGILSQEGRLDLVVNCAVGALKLRRFDELTIEEVQADFDVILKGSANLFHAAIPAMKKARSGTIIQILTAALDSTPPRMSTYLAAKAGVLGLMKGISAELAPFGVRMLGISPGFVETPLLGAFPAKLLELERERSPGKAFTQPAEIASLVTRIAGDAAAFPAGMIIPVPPRETP